LIFIQGLPRLDCGLDIFLLTGGHCHRTFSFCTNLPVRRLRINGCPRQDDRRAIQTIDHTRWQNSASAGGWMQSGQAAHNPMQKDFRNAGDKISYPGFGPIAIQMMCLAGS
jgi:hypothetical protein